VSLIYLRLPSVEASIERVRRRVEAGGHAVPEAVIRRRFARSIDYLDRIYKPIVDDWSVWESLEGDFSLLETSSNIA
jgi:predicted ABC-type ATPase